LPGSYATFLFITTGRIFALFFAGTGVWICGTAFFENFLGNNEADGHAKEAETEYEECYEVIHESSIGELPPKCNT